MILAMYGGTELNVWNIERKMIYCFILVMQSRQNYGMDKYDL